MARAGLHALIAIVVHLVVLAEHPPDGVGDFLWGEKRGGSRCEGTAIPTLRAPSGGPALRWTGWLAMSFSSFVVDELAGGASRCDAGAQAALSRFTAGTCCPGPVCADECSATLANPRQNQSDVV